MWDCHLDRLDITKHLIVLTLMNAQPIHSASYCAGSKQRELERNELEKIREAGVVKPAATEWATPIVSVPEKEGSLRLYVGFCRLDAVTERDSYLNFWMNECIDLLGYAKMFSTLDASSGYR